MRAAIQMRLKSNTVIADLAQRAETEDLITAAVGQDRSVPSHELMQAAQFCNGFMAWPQGEMVRIAKQNHNMQVSYLIRRNTLHGRLRSDRHEDRRYHDYK